MHGARSCHVAHCACEPDRLAGTPFHALQHSGDASSALLLTCVLCLLPMLHDACSHAKGDVDVLSMPPHGTEVFLSRLPREATDAQVRGPVIHTLKGLISLLQPCLACANSQQ